MSHKDYFLTVVVPLHNEAEVIDNFHLALVDLLKKISGRYEIIYVNDGSSDESLDKLHHFAKENQTVRVLSLSRNFGKEIATTAGINAASGDAIVTIDSDGQHPVELIPDFIKKWQAGHKVVVGLRSENQKEGFIKKQGSRLFYWMINKLTGVKMVSRTTDFRLIDKTVQQQFMMMTERNRITRGLIDWLGFERSYIEFVAKPRNAGEASYTFKKLFKLAIDSIISLSVSPLFIAAYIGAVVLPVSALVGLVMIIDNILGDPLKWHITGGAYVMILVLFLVGILLISQGIIGLYLSHIHAETQNRPLYVVDKEKSVRV